MNNKKQNTMKRLISYITKNYKKQFVLVIVCIILSSIASTASSLFLQTLIDDYITPLLGVQNPVFTGLLKAICLMATIYLVGVISAYVYNRFMAVIAQGVLKKIRDEMFDKMQSLPIRFFDTNTHGEIMSYYTNDTDTLRQMISQSLPQIISSVITIITVVCSMLYLSPLLTLLVLIFTVITVFITKTVASKSSKHYVNQQNSLGKVNGYVEEMLNGQKVVKVFTHEEQAKAGFKEINDALYHDMYEANKYSNIMMPVANNLGNLQYVIVAIIGTILALNGTLALSIGTIVSFLQLTKNFVQPINQVMNQMSSIIMALAGAKRVFALIDEEPEKDEGYVTLVNVKKENDKLIETDKNTNMWAWKHPHHNGRLEYVELKGHIELENVDFGYEEGKTVLHDITLYAKPGQKIAFVGATGAGKTTITNLINRFYDIEDGKIRYDGININKIKKADLRKSLRNGTTRYEFIYRNYKR